MAIYVLWLSWCLLGLELWASLLRWHGLTWLGWRWRWLTGGLFAAVSGALAVTGIARQPWQLAITAFAGLLLFSAGVTWRRRQLDAAALFVPGTRGSRRVDQLLIPLEEGPLPAVLVEPVMGSETGILLLHGAGDHKTHFTWPLLHSLADAGFAVCSIDVDGHGDNPRTLNFPAVLDNVVAGVAWLRQRYRHVAVLGISQGGCIATRAIADGVAVDALVLLETPIKIQVTRAVVRAEMRILAHPAAWALHREAGTLALARGWRTPPTRTRIGTAALIERLDVLGSIGRIAAPVLLVYGSSDAVVPLDQAHTVAAAAPPGTPLLVVPRATHLSLSIDRRVGRLVAEWLRQQLVRSTDQQQRTGTD